MTRTTGRPVTEAEWDAWVLKHGQQFAACWWLAQHHAKLKGKARTKRMPHKKRGRNK